MYNVSSRCNWTVKTISTALQCILYHKGMNFRGSIQFCCFCDQTVIHEISLAELRILFSLIREMMHVKWIVCYIKQLQAFNGKLSSEMVATSLEITMLFNQF